MTERRKFHFVNTEELSVDKFDSKKDIGSKFLKVDAQPELPNQKEYTISQKDVDNYALELLNHYQALLRESENDHPSIFILESLSPYNLIVRFYLGLNPEYDSNDKRKEIREKIKLIDVTVNRLRTALMESIRKVINSDATGQYADIKFDQLFFSHKIPDYFRPKYPRGAKGYHENTFVKKDIDYDPVLERFRESRSKFLDTLEDDIKKGELPPPFIKIPKYRNSTERTYLSPELPMSELGTWQDDIEERNKTDKNDAIFALKILLDFVKACQYIEKKGFVLGDIKPDNIGYTKSTGDGFAFDFDAMMRPGERIRGRFGAQSLTREYGFNFSEEVISNEMVFQIGMCIDLIFGEQDGIKKYTRDKDLIAALDKLLIYANDLMIDFRTRQNKITLKDIEDKLEFFKKSVFEVL